MLGAVVQVQQAYTVSELTGRIKATLERDFPDITIEGEISNFRAASSGHYYFTLKDDKAVIQVVMFRNRNIYLQFEPADGQFVRARGDVSVYARRGNYQLICEEMELAGTGNILAMLEERKQRLAREGLFEEARKKPLPPYPERVAVVTSPSGAAIRDIINVTGRRHAGINIVVLPTAVQGDGAAEKIAAQIRRADRYRLGDIIIVARGGGSLEDLLPFSEEVVVRAVAAAETPTVSAVGHEVDVALCDLAADRRAPTPSAAGELVSANREQVLERVMELGKSIISSFRSRYERARLLVSQFKPENLEHNFRTLVQPLYMRLDDAKEDLLQSMDQRLTRIRHRLEMARERLYAVSPRETLKRGFAIVTDPESGSVISRASQTKPEDRIHVRFSEDGLNAQVTEHTDDEKEL
jgi:exodeoxyribonuclease VII large subunit